MTEVFISGLIATTVSLIGLFVQNRIAKKAREATEKQLKVQAQITEQMQTLSDIRELATQCELIRNQCWTLLRIFTNFKILKSLGTDMEVYFQNFGNFIEMTTRLREHEIAFRESWAPIRVALPSMDSDELRNLRHQCIDAICDALVFCEYFSVSIENDFHEVESYDLSLLEALLRDTLNKVDDFIISIAKFRNHFIGLIGEQDTESFLKQGTE